MSHPTPSPPVPFDPLDRDLWVLDPETTYLNHGSFSPALRCVQEARRTASERLDRQPMDFFLRQWEPALAESRERLARFLGTAAGNLTLVDNATYGMNVVAASLALGPDDEVLINDHEYGAVFRIWQRACDRAGARLVRAPLPDAFDDPEYVVDCLARAMGPRIRLLVVSHITSATALVMPVAALCHEARQRGIAVCIDGPHAPVQVDLNLDRLGCDYYTASCHKWLAGPLGSGFLYVNPDRQPEVSPPILSWGRLGPAIPERWDEEFTWLGTRDSSAWLALPAALDFWDQVGIDVFRQHSRRLAEYAENQLADAFSTRPIAARTQGWYASMAHVPLPPGDHSGVQARLWENHRIESMLVEFNQRWFVRVSCHLYNDRSQIDRLTEALLAEIR